jgi:hypothetical protein
MGPHDMNRPNQTNQIDGDTEKDQRHPDERLPDRDDDTVRDEESTPPRIDEPEQDDA